MQFRTSVILSAALAESKNLRMIVIALQLFGAKILRLTSFAQDDRLNKEAFFLLLFRLLCCKMTKGKKKGADASMFDQDYSKRVWIISIVMAIGAIAMDIALLLGEDGIMKDTVWMTLPLTVYILYKCVQGLIKKIKEEKGE